MEKIYMEENKKKTKQRKSLKASVFMSLVLAFVAIASIVAFGFGQTSFAIPDEATTPFPDKITTGQEGTQEYKVRGESATTQIAIHRATVNGAEKYVYCIESDKEIASNATYNKNVEIGDKGLLFLMNYLLSDSTKIVDGTGAELPAKAQAWVIQTAIWTYQHDMKATNNTKELSDAAVKAFATETKLYLLSDYPTILYQSTSGAIYDTVKISGSDLADPTITGVLKKAEKIGKGTEEWYAFKVTLNKNSDNISITSDKKYYMSDKITVNGSDGFLGYSLKLPESAPEGTLIVDVNGNEIKDLSNFTSGTQFYVKVPIDKVTNDNKVFSVEVTAAFQGDMAYKYVSGDNQAIAYTGKITKHVKTGVEVSLDYTPGTPDTGMTVAQSVYFIGLVILCAGVGIIYANVKPSKAV